MNRLPRIVVGVALCILAGACGSEAVQTAVEETEIVEQPAFENVIWRLVEYLDETGKMRPGLDQIPVEVKFSDGDLGGTAGCNRYFGSYTIGGGNQVTIGSQMGSTQMACPPEVMSQEQRFLALLGQTATLARSKDQLRLLNAQSEVLLHLKAMEAATLENTEWQTTGINNGKGGVVSSATTSASTAVFTDGQVSGSGGCNQFTATFETDGDQITIGPAAATRMLCNEPEGVMDQEQQFFEALGRARSFSLTAEKLELRDESGSLQVGFRAIAE